MRFHENVNLMDLMETPSANAAKGEAASPAKVNELTRLCGMERGVRRNKKPSTTDQRMGEWSIERMLFLLKPPVMTKIPRVNMNMPCTWS